ncbi:hypothetical protein HJC23_007454 [Cyclotella cryptica]|uniref:Uncharacterized protein n=1 Tax=Cyclotella cryptica TaxID=29204 RepID=A0ABD3QJH2_9STRA|eukprot:CCRYP_005205-RA/>CCRYP_005205-RA protein AED:0.02 eAED:0.02 QI:158/1/1/1/1/1/2/1740/319
MLLSRSLNRVASSLCKTRCRLVPTVGLLIFLVAIPSITTACFVDSRVREHFYYRRAQPSSLKHPTRHFALGSGSRESDRITVYESDRENTRVINRRKFVVRSSLPILSLILSMNPNYTHAACLPGDIRSECIGVYKMPLDDAVLPYVDTPERLRKFAPDLNWVPPIEYPPNFSAAVTQIHQQRSKLDLVRDLILKGDLNQGGLVLLDVVPNVSAAGKVILKGFGDAVNKERNLQMKRNKGNDGAFINSEKATTLDMRAYRFEYSMNELLGYLGEVDVLIGQGLRGELGAFAPAQIQILSSLDEAQSEFDEIIRIIPDKI